MKGIIAFAVIHALAGACGYLGLAIWAAGAMDSGSANGWLLRSAAGIVRYVLLQPLAYWLIELGELRWWTWPGIVALLAVCAVNSLCVAALLRFAARALGARY